MENIKVGDKVRFIDESAHLKHARYFPAVGTMGEVVSMVINERVVVQWPSGSTSGDDRWNCGISQLELVIETEEKKNSEPDIMDEQKAKALLRKWVSILGLESWDIVFRWKLRANDMAIPDSLGCAQFTFESRQAIIQMLDPVDFDNPDFAYDYEKTLVHELLHLKFAKIDDSGDALRDKITHQLIDDLARAFVKCKEE